MKRSERRLKLQLIIEEEAWTGLFMYEPEQR